MQITIPVPKIAGALSNLLGLAGITAILTAVAFLLDWRWSLLLGGFVSLAVAYVAHLNSQRLGQVHQLDDARKPRAA